MADALLKPLLPEAAPLEALASFNKAASDPLRLEALRVMRNNSYGVLELCHILDVKQSALSHHLKVLAQAELVDTRREGNSIFYRRHCRGSQDPFFALQLALFETIDDQPLQKTTLARLQHIQKDRAASSKNFFRQQAASFEQQQERIATHALYGHSVLDLLQNANLAKRDCALEVGPGNGEFLVELAPLFKQVIALDNSEEMLTRAKQQVAEKKLAHVQFVHGDTEKAIEKKLLADCIVLNMVLHHVPSPADMFEDLFQLCHEGGILLVTELCRHQQDWVKQACGDLWQGFEPEELLLWARDAGFSIEQNVYHALRNGFQIQIHSFRKPSLNHSL